MGRNGWSAGMRSSNRTYENNPSDRASRPRIANHPWLQIHGITCHPASRVEFFSSLLILLSQYVASFSNETHVFGKIHFSACGGAEMSLPKSGEAASRFSAYVEGLTSAIGHA